MNPSRIAEFKASGKFDQKRAELVEKYANSEAWKQLESAISDHVTRALQTNPELLEDSSHAAQSTLYMQVRQCIRLMTLQGSKESEEFLKEGVHNFEKTLMSEWKYPEIE